MDTKLQSKLYKKYPSIFKDRKKSIQESCMPWGISTGNGWYNLLDSLCAFILNLERNNKGIKIIADQVKEKFGTLRFYYHIEGDLKPLKQLKETIEDRQKRMERVTEYLDGAIDLSFYLSSRVCEDCGAPAKIQTKGYISNICENCKKLREEAMKKYSTKSECQISKEGLIKN